MDADISRGFDSLEHTLHQLRVKLANVEKRLAAVEQRTVDLGVEIDEVLAVRKAEKTKSKGS